MIIQKISYKEVDDAGNEWSLNDFSFGKINLVVGKNSTGKSRALNIIGSLGASLAGERKISNGCFDVDFIDDDKKVKYSLHVHNNKISKENLFIDGNDYLTRGENGEGMIYAEELDQSIKFQVPDNTSACVARRDSIQHPFFETLYEWGRSMRHFYFGTQLGKDSFAIFIDRKETTDLNAKDTKNVVAFFNEGIKKFGHDFKKLILNDINSIGYNFSEVDIGPMKKIELEGAPVKNPEGLYLKEISHSHQVIQTEMSQGLFRALSLFIQLRFSEKFSVPSLIVIDDIGEGLDFERSSALIRAIIEIAKTGNTQLIMSTNDRFVMNDVPLEYWSILHREGAECKVYNHINSKDIFDEFEFTGLSNFDFFSSKYYKRVLDDN